MDDAGTTPHSVNAATQSQRLSGAHSTPPQAKPRSPQTYALAPSNAASQGVSAPSYICWGDAERVLRSALCTARQLRRKNIKPPWAVHALLAALAEVCGTSRYARKDEDE
jgi:hypothetical protein